MIRPESEALRGSAAGSLSFIHINMKGEVSMPLINIISLMENALFCVPLNLTVYRLRASRYNVPCFLQDRFRSCARTCDCT